MRQASVIVYERTALWGPALRRHLPAEIRVRETRGLAECAVELAAAPESMLVVEVTRENLARVLALLGELGRTFPLARAVVVADRGFDRVEGLLREAGAVHFTVSPRSLPGWTRSVVRHFERLPAPRANLAADVWNTLPWSDVATT